MDIIINVFDNFKLPIIIWNMNTMKCHYSNTSICNKDDHIDKYALINNIPNYKYFIDNLCNNKFSQIIKMIDKNVILEYINNDYFYEIHYCINDYNDMVFVIVYKIRQPISDILNILSQDNVVNAHDIIKKACYNMMNIVNDIIDIMNINKMRLINNNRNFDIKELITTCNKVVEDDSRIKQITIHTDISKNINNIFFGDFDKIKQILINILINAIKFTSVGGIHFLVLEYVNNNNCPFTVVKSKSKINILFKIKDTGIGISDNIKYSLNSLLNIPCNKELVKKDKIKGFGLFISYNLCVFLNGIMWYKTEKDVGTVFYVLLPLMINKL